MEDKSETNMNFIHLEVLFICTLFISLAFCYPSSFVQINLQPRLFAKLSRNLFGPDIARIERPKNCNSEVCVTFISCNRPHFLELNFKRLLTHFQTYEPWLCYDLNWIDQATPNRTRFSQAYDFNKRLWASKKSGYAFAFTHAFSMCQAPYMLIVEEDLVIREDVNFPLISHAIDLLKQLPHDVYGIVMHEVWMDRSDKLTKVDGKTKYADLNTWTLKRRRYQWNNGGILVRMSNVHELLAKAPYISEKQFGSVAQELGFIYAVMVRGEQPFKNWVLSEWFFDHIATDNVAFSAIRNPEGCSGESFS